MVLGDYLDVADTVIQMHDYQAVDVTEKAQEVIAQHPTQRTNECETALETFVPRSLKPRCTDEHSLLDGKFRVNAKGKESLRFAGKEFADLSALEQLESTSEVKRQIGC
ncbi:hypothetical protein O9992_28610 [Vibrio lentus]|nr:hypothetical protein [Vibrio lentus]